MVRSLINYQNIQIFWARKDLKILTVAQLVFLCTSWATVSICMYKCNTYFWRKQVKRHHVTVVGIRIYRQMSPGIAFRHKSNSKGNSSRVTYVVLSQRPDFGILFGLFRNLFCQLCSISLYIMTGAFPQSNTKGNVFNFLYIKKENKFWISLYLG